MNLNLHMFRDEIEVKKGFLTSAGLLFFIPEKTHVTNELMTIVHSFDQTAKEFTSIT